MCEPLSISHVERSIPPSSPQLLESRAVGLAHFGFDEVHIMSGYSLANRSIVVEGLVVVLEQVFQTKVRCSLPIIFESEEAEFIVHVCVKVSNKKVRPELIKDIHVIRAAAQYRILSLKKCF